MWTDADIEAIGRFLEQVYACRRIERFAPTVITELPRLVGALQTTWNDISPSIGRVRVMANPIEADHEARQEALSRHVHEHPLMRHYAQTGDVSAVKLSDFLSEAAFHRTALYEELYRPLRYEDHFAMHLVPPGPRDWAVVVARDRRTFTERDRQLLNLLRPHIARAYRHARAYDRLTRRLAARVATRPQTCRLLVTRGGRVVSLPRRAQRWLAEFADGPARSPTGLPEPFASWFARAMTTPPGAAALRVRRRRGELVAHHAGPSGPDASTVAVLLERRPAAAPALTDAGLSRRELDVLRLVERGLTNLEIAAALGISESTVKRHLEHVFEKLGVHTRTAAVARLRGEGP